MRGGRRGAATVSGRPTGRRAVTVADPELLDDLDDNEYDAELILEYLAFLDASKGDGVDLGPPGSARADGSLAADNEAAWPLVRADPRWAGLGLDSVTARNLASGQLQRWDAAAASA